MGYPVEFRRRILSVCEKQNLSSDEAARRFGISRHTILNWRKRIESMTHKCGGRRKICMTTLAADVRDHPESRLCDRAGRFGVSSGGMHFALKRLQVRGTEL